MCTAAGHGAGFAAGPSWLLPLVDASCILPLFVLALRGGRRREAFLLGLVWALLVGALSTAWTVAFPARAGEVIWNGPAYARAMDPWLRTGRGEEADPRRFLPRHFVEAVVFGTASLATGGAGGFVMGAMLLNYMAFYVGELVRGAEHPFLAVALGWHPWSLVRIVAYLCLGTVLSELFWRRITSSPPAVPGQRRWWVWGIAGLLGDVVLKGLLAPHWWIVLGAATGIDH